MTKSLLRIDASARYSDSVSRALADQIVAKLAPSTITIRDLNNTIPHVDGAWIGANFTPADERSSDQQDTLALSDELIGEVKAADTILIATPIYNFGVPASFKSWFDQVARVGITFKYTDTGPVGLLQGKRAILALASGGTEVDSAIDFATPWLRHVMGFIGISDVQVVRSDRLMADADAAKARSTDDIAKLIM